MDRSRSGPPPPQKGDRVGPWKLIKRLGKGANAWVWQADDNGRRRVALKILMSTKINAEPYKRFRAEIQALSEMGDRPGVLPMICHDLPEKPSGRSRAWLAMPVAVPMKDELGPHSGLRQVVEAVAAIAEALAGLASDGVYHRDIKPSNLYRYEETWVVGDFGLVQYPDKPQLTQPGKKLGPTYFIPLEMLNDPRRADSGPADVYCLAQTLWVLATGQNFPPGAYRADDLFATVEHYVEHPQVAYLDRLIEQATNHDPTKRPTMAEMADELNAWLAPPREPASPTDISDVRKRILAATAPVRSADELRQGRIEEANKVMQYIDERLERLMRSVDGLTPIIKKGRNEILLAKHPRPVCADSQEATWKDGRCVVVHHAQAGRPVYYVWSGFGLELLTDGQLYVVAAHLLGPDTEHTETIWHDTHLAHVGSAKLQQGIDSLADGLMDNLRAALARFASALET